MAEVKQLTCPACGGIISAPPGVTRITCPYCGSSLVVDLDKEEATLYVAQQAAASRDKDRLAQERQDLYQQYLSMYNEAQKLYDEARQLQLMRQTPAVRQQLNDIYRQQSQLGQGMTSISGQIQEIDRMVNPGLVAQLPVPAPLPVPRRQLGLVQWVVIIVMLGFFLMCLCGLILQAAGVQPSTDLTPVPTAVPTAAITIPESPSLPDARSWELTMPERAAATAGEPGPFHHKAYLCGWHPASRQEGCSPGL